MDLSEILSNEEKLLIECILRKVSEQMDIELSELMKIFNLNYIDPIDKLIGKENNYNINLCKAKVDENKQCSRKSKKNGFCMTHYKLHEKNELSNVVEFVDDEFKIIIKNLRDRRGFPRLIDTKLIIIHGDEYLIDPYTSEVFDFKTYKYVGKLDMMDNLKLKWSRNDLIKHMLNKVQTDKTKTPLSIINK